MLSSAYFALGSSWDAPTEAQRIYLEQAEARLAEVLEEVNQVFAEDVPAFRQQVGQARLELFPEEEPLMLDWVRSGEP
jgi:alkanesulfonate monooxygenase SsuD/methylene tetrahydromethanopterin reductase-like flavin-dependent oxidoreductase (luciferase family)